MESDWPARQCHAMSAGDEALLVRAAQADPAAFAPLYVAWYPRIERFLRFRGAGPDAADLAQQVFLQALAALPRYQERGVPFSAWLFRIARNVATDAHRRARHAPLSWDLLPELPARDARDDPEAALLHAERLARLRARIDALDPGKRELLALRFAGGLTSREIAAVVGKREGAVKKMLTRTLATLREDEDDA